MPSSSLSSASDPVPVPIVSISLIVGKLTGQDAQECGGNAALDVLIDDDIAQHGAGPRIDDDLTAHTTPLLLGLGSSPLGLKPREGLLDLSALGGCWATRFAEIFHAINKALNPLLKLLEGAPFARAVRTEGCVRAPVRPRLCWPGERLQAW